MSGDIVVLPGAPMDDFIASLGQLAAAQPVVIGGLAVMSRVGGEHRPTLDIDSAFNNETDTTTTTRLVTEGIATKADAPQRVIIGNAVIDVIDTFPIEPDDLPDNPAPRLFVCAHRYAFETATDVDFVGDTNRIAVQVATPDALIAMKSHALRFGTPQRRASKRTSDLYDVIRLVTSTDGEMLVDAPWQLRVQVLTAITEDLGRLLDRSTAAALLRRSPVEAISAISPELLNLVIDRLRARLTDQKNS